MPYSRQLPELAIEVKGKKMLVRTHEGPHTDEAAAIVLIKHYADQEFFDLHTQKMCLTRKVFFELFPGEEEQSEQAVHLIELGVKGAELDEHQVSGKSLKDPGKCCAELAARIMGIDGFKEVKNLLGYVGPHDRYNYQQNGKRDIGTVLRIMNKVWPEIEDQVNILAWGILGLEAKLLFDPSDEDFSVDRIGAVIAANQAGIAMNARAWLEMAQLGLARGKEAINRSFDLFREMEKNGDIYSYRIPVRNLKTGKSKPRRIIALSSDDPNLGIAMMGKAGGDASVAIIRNSQGNYAILTKKWHLIPTGEIATVLRYREQELNGLVIETDPAELKSDGTVVGSEIWYHHLEARRILNGSFSHPEIPASKMPFKEVIASVLIALDERAYKYADCSSGICRYRRCSFYNFGLTKCFCVRKKNYGRESKK